MILGGGQCECHSTEVGGDWEAGQWWWWWVVEREYEKQRLEGEVGNILILF